MPRGRKPAGETSLSNAERQARYRSRHPAPDPSVVIRTQRPVDRRSHPSPLARCRRRIGRTSGHLCAWLEALPDTLQGTATAEALQAIVDLDLDMLAAIEPPRGYGRD